MQTKKFSGSVVLSDFYADNVRPDQDIAADEIADAMLRDGGKRVFLHMRSEWEGYAFADETL